MLDLGIQVEAEHSLKELTTYLMGVEGDLIIVNNANDKDISLEQMTVLVQQQTIFYWMVALVRLNFIITDKTQQNLLV